MELLDFSKDEIQKRIDLCRERMKESGFSGMLLSAESNLNYYADYKTHAPWTTFTRPSFLFMPENGSPLLYVQTFVEPEARTAAKCCQVKGFQSLLGPTAKDLLSIMEELRMENGNIGIESGFEQRIGFQLNLYESLKDLLPNVNFLDASALIWNQRMIKSEVEIECHRRACQATSYAHDHLFSMVHGGMTEIEISRLAQKLMLDGGAHYPGFVIITSGTGNYGRISKTASNRTLEEGDFLWLDLGARYNNYWSDFCRAGVVGKREPHLADLQKKIHEITLSAAETIKPDVPVADVARACKNALEKAGFQASFECGRMGHGMGLMSTEPPSITIFDQTILKEGMIINLEPGVVNDSGVFDVEENFVVTKTGCECLSGGTRALHWIPLK